MDGHGDGGGHGGGADFGHGGVHGGHMHHGGDSHGGHATIEALMVSYAHGSSGHGLSNFGAHVSGADPHSMQMVHLGLGRQDTKVGSGTQSNEAPGEVRVFVAHVTNHGQSQVLTKLQAFARQHDMLRIDQVRPNFDAVDGYKYELADWTAFTEPYTHKNMPEGYYPGATGRTRVIRQYYQVGKRPAWWAPHKPPVFDKHAGTFIEISVIEWSYYETGDFETKLIFSVNSLAVWDEVQQAWGYKAKPFKLHQHAAIKLCEELFDYLVSVKPTRAAALLRADMVRKYPPQTGHDDGVKPGTPEDEADLTRGRKDDPEMPPPPAGSPPADDGGGDDTDFATPLIAPALVAADSGADLDAVLGPDDASAVATAPASASTAKSSASTVTPKTATLIVVIDD